MSRSSTRRAQVEPIAALAATFAVCLGLALYAGALDATLPGDRDPDVAKPTLTRTEAAASSLGVVEPTRLAATHGPDGYAVNATLAATDRRWTAGPTPPARAGAACRRTSVRVRPATVRPGRLCVEVWS